MSTNQSPFRSLQLVEAKERFDLLDVTSYDVSLDLAGDEKTFASRTTIDFASRGGDTFVDLKAVHVERITLNGADLDPGLVERGRLPLATTPGENRLVVDAVMPFRHDGEGLHRSVDPADGAHYVYGMSFMDAAPTIFACFDQPDLKAPYTFHVTAPDGWTVIGNAPGTKVETRPDGVAVWEFEQTRPLSTYFVTLVAGPYHLIHDEHDDIPLSLSCRASIAEALDDDADELLTMTKQCFDEFHRLFGIRYPFGNYHQAFVPEFNAGAMENPGCVTFRDPLLFTSRVTRGDRIRRATTVAHEMAHQWFGNLTTPKWWDDLWLNESFAEYMGNRVTADVTQYTDAWIHNGYARRQWGLTADHRPTTHPVAGNGAVDATAALQDFDGISYAKGSTILRQLNANLGDEVFFAGVIDHFERHRFGNATMHDLLGSWERAGAGDLSDFAANWLSTTGADRLEVARDAGVVRRTSPAASPATRQHAIEIATQHDGRWTSHQLVIDADEVPLDLPEGPVVLDAGLASWALTLPDETSLAAYPEVLATTDDDTVRMGIWNSVRSAFHHAMVAPEQVLALAEASLPTESNDDALMATLPFLLGKVVPLSSDPAAALLRLHRACSALVAAAPAGSTVQLAGFQGAVGSCAEADLLQSWRAGRDLPAELKVDADLRWRILSRLATLGALERAELDDELRRDPTTKATVDHAGAVSRLPDAEAKAWAWSRFTGEEPVSNYELIACGVGMWRPGQEEFTTPYVARYFDELPGATNVHAGWVLGNVTEHFFPISSIEDSTLARADEVAATEGLDLTIRRNLVDMADELRRRLAIRAAFA